MAFLLSILCFYINISLYRFGELVDTRHADFLGRGRTVQLEEVVEANVSAGRRDRMSDGEEDGGREEEGRLTDSLEQPKHD